MIRDFVSMLSDDTDKLSVTEFNADSEASDVERLSDKVAEKAC